ncbi:MAG: hypothetical protein IPI58_08195 [Alphaproteobacteria bacterium]|nr:MAG: hypothetical protein IPI58_08195 [Alphaproteobacteria bacterium]
MSAVQVQPVKLKPRQPTSRADMDPISAKLSAEQALHDHLRHLDRHRQEHMALHMRLSLLQPGHRRASYLRVATETFEEAIRPLPGGRLFVLANQDLIYVGKAVHWRALASAAQHVRVLFEDDPLTRQDDFDGDVSLCGWYPLDTTYDDLNLIVQRMVREASRARHLPAMMRPKKEESRAPMDAEAFSRLARTLETADVDTMVRHQSICAMATPDGEPQPMFEEIFIAIDSLRERVAPGLDLHSDPWLFQALTRSLDDRLLAHLTREIKRRPIGPLSINLHVETLLSPEFRRFEERVVPQMRGRLLIEIHKLDLMAEMNSFLFIRDRLKARGHRLCLDGLTPATLGCFNREALGFDFVKLLWAADGLQRSRPQALPGVRSQIQACGGAHIILCRCDSETALTIGRDLGIVLFEGREVERRLGLRATR